MRIAFVWVASLALYRQCLGFSSTSFVSRSTRYVSPTTTSVRTPVRPPRRPTFTTSFSYSSALFALKITIRIVGRKDPWMEQACDVYNQRLGSALSLETIWHKTDDQLVRNVESDASKQHAIVLLDPTVGKEYTSEQFAKKVYDWLEQGGSRLVFVIGGAEGLPAPLRQMAYPAVSLSKLTLTHQFARLILVEQIYRASEIRKGTDYHK